MLYLVCFLGVIGLVCDVKASPVTTYMGKAVHKAAADDALKSLVMTNLCCLFGVGSGIELCQFLRFFFSGLLLLSIHVYSSFLFSLEGRILDLIVLADDFNSKW